MQLDVDVSPPANIMTFKPGLTYLTYDLDPRDLLPWPLTLKVLGAILWEIWFFSSRIFSHRQTPDRQKVRHKSPPCMSTGGLNKSDYVSVISEKLKAGQPRLRWLQTHRKSRTTGNGTSCSKLECNCLLLHPASRAPNIDCYAPGIRPLSLTLTSNLDLNLWTWPMTFVLDLKTR